MQTTSLPYRQIAVQDADLATRLTLDCYPRSAAYNPRWVLENLMGPNVLWLAEALAQQMDLRPGMRVLDMGCGRAVSSIFLAREFGVQVWATDLWIKPTENWRRIAQTEVAERVFPIHAEAHALPYADGFFDALISLDAYQYFGTSDLYLAYYSRLVKEGGQIGMVVPGVRQEFAEVVPEHLWSYWQPDFACFHSPDWWQRHWERSGAVEAIHADFLPDGWRQWLLWDEVSLEMGYVHEQFREHVCQLIETFRIDAGRTMGFTRVVARRKAAEVTP
jgi:ubiquinone/menaquinone biosynthesis C-methylase UbiE